MKIDWTQVKIYIKPGITDMRKQINGLSVIAEADLGEKVFKGDLFLFCGRNRRRLKILYWDRNGFCLWLKKLEKDKFPWPMTEAECREISQSELFMLLAGINFFNAHKRLIFSAVS